MAQVTHIPPIPESLPFPPVSIYTEREKTGPKNSRNGRKRDKTGHRPKHTERACMALTSRTKGNAGGREIAALVREWTCKGSIEAWAAVAADCEVKHG